MEEQAFSEESLWIQREKRTAGIIARAIATVLTVVFALGALFNLYVLVNGFLKYNGYPSAFGITPIVVAESEDPDAKEYDDYVKPGDLLFALEKNMKQYVEGDVVAFSHNGIILIGKIASVENRNGNVLSFTVQASFLDDPFRDPATQDNLIGDIDYRIPNVGYFILFLATLPGRLVFIGIPLLIYLILLLVGAWMEGYAYRRARRTFLRPSSGKKVPLGEVAFWSYLSATLFALAALCYGTRDSNRTDRAMKKRAAAALAGVKTEPHTQPVTHPVRMRRNRPIKPQRRKPTRALKPAKPITPIRPRPWQD